MNIEDDPSDIVPGSVYRTLLQFALLGTEIGQIDSALEIAQVLKELRPDLPHAGIVLAMSDFAAGREDQGIRSLENTLSVFPDSQLAKAMLAVCLQSANRGGWQELLEAVVADGRDEHAVGLACAVLGRRNIDMLPKSTASKIISIPTNAMWA
jgi:tetratricopeptide (TPR) repeat protein